MKAMSGITAKQACKKHKSEPIYEVSVYDIEHKGSFVYQNNDTMNVYLTVDEAKDAARNVAYNIAWHDQLMALDNAYWRAGRSARKARFTASEKSSMPYPHSRRR